LGRTRRGGARVLRACVCVSGPEKRAQLGRPRRRPRQDV